MTVTQTLCWGSFGTRPASGSSASFCSNDGTGYFRTRTELPHPKFNRGVTRVMGVARHDINDDGWDDLFMLHVRNGIQGGWTGRYVQALLNRGDGTFVDETRTWVQRQRVTAIRGQNYGGLAMHDVDLDGCQDLVVTAPVDRIRPQSPLVYRNNGSGQFAPMRSSRFVPDRDEQFGWGAMPVDANGDGAIDFVAAEPDAGSTRLVTLLNTTRPMRRPLCR